MVSAIMDNESKEIKRQTSHEIDQVKSGDGDSSSFINDQEKNEAKKFIGSDLPEDTELPGVRKIEVIASQEQSVLFKIIFGFSVFFAAFAYGLDSNTRTTFTQYATQHFNANSLLSTINVVSTIIGAAGQVGYSRTMDIFGRFETYLLAVIFYVIGTIVQSQATSVAKYATGAVFYQLGYTGIVLILLIVMADFSSLRWRLFFMNTTTFPFIIIPWMYGNVVQDVGAEEHWSWGVGMWAFILPLANIPFACCIAYLYWKVYKSNRLQDVVGLNTKRIRENGFFSFMLDIFWKLDVLGILLLAVCLGCILTPLTLAGGEKKTWNTAHIIVPLVIGCCLIPAVICYEIYVSKFPFCPKFFLQKRGIWPPLVICFLLNFISMVVSEYLYNVLLVSINESMTSATRISTISNFVSTVVGFFLGLAVVYIRHLEPFILFGTLMWILACGLFIHFRGGTSSHSGVLGGECVIGLGTGFFTYPILVVLQSHVPHDYLASVTSFSFVLYRVGSAVGLSVGGAIWTQLLYPSLSKHLSSEDARSAFAQPYTFIQKYKWGTSERQHAVDSYKHVQRILCIVGICFSALMFLIACIIRERKLTGEQCVERKGVATLEEAEEERFDLFRFFNKKRRSSKAKEENSTPY